jgi:O-antigen ligase
VLGTGKVWNKFNRGEDSQQIWSLSGRTQLWSAVIAYCAKHPQGMGYIAGIRSSRITVNGGSDLDATLTHMGGTDNSYFATLADAGWIALIVYLAILIKVAMVGRRFAVKRSCHLRSARVPRYAIQCSLLLFLFCLIDGMDSSVFATPLSQPYYFQNIVVAIILGAATTIILARRRQRVEAELTINGAGPALRPPPYNR